MNLAYRDEIPPVPMNGRPGFSLSPKMLMLIIGGIVLVIISLLLLSLTNSGSISPQLQRLSARLSAMQEIVEISKGSVTDPDLSKANSDLSILTTGSIARLQAPMKAAGMDKVGDDVKKAEADAATLKNLEDAKLTGVFDRTYTRIVIQKIDTILSLMNEIYDKTNNKALQSALRTTYNDYFTTQKQLKALNL